jgi:hypothetical protein
MTAHRGNSGKPPFIEGVLVPDISKECSKCPILIKEIAVIKDLQIKMNDKLDEFIKKAQYEERLAALEKSVNAILTLLIEKATQ